MDERTAYGSVSTGTVTELLAVKVERSLIVAGTAPQPLLVRPSQACQP